MGVELLSGRAQQAMFVVRTYLCVRKIIISVEKSDFFARAQSYTRCIIDKEVKRKMLNTASKKRELSTEVQRTVESMSA